MRIDERNIFLRESSTDGFEVVRSRGAWYMLWANGSPPTVVGPFSEKEILRAFRVAAAGVMDGCELVAWKRSFFDLSPVPRPARRDWLSFSVAVLPASETRYTATAVEPVHGCCTTFAAMPSVRWEDNGTRGVLQKLWNAHPAGSGIEGDSRALERGLTIFDVP